MIAESTQSDPSDDLETVAPNLLKSDFKFERKQWSGSPKRLISFQRRQELWRHKPDKAYDFVVRNQSFSVE